MSSMFPKRGGRRDYWTRLCSPVIKWCAKWSVCLWKNFGENHTWLQQYSRPTQTAFSLWRIKIIVRCRQWRSCHATSFSFTVKVCKINQIYYVKVQTILTAQVHTMYKYIQRGPSMTSWLIHTYFLLVDPYSFNAVKRVWIDQNKKLYWQQKQVHRMYKYIQRGPSITSWSLHILFALFDLSQF